MGGSMNWLKHFVRFCVVATLIFGAFGMGNHVRADELLEQVKDECLSGLRECVVGLEGANENTATVLEAAVSIRDLAEDWKEIAVGCLDDMSDSTDDLEKHTDTLRKSVDQTETAISQTHDAIEAVEVAQAIARVCLGELDVYRIGDFYRYDEVEPIVEEKQRLEFENETLQGRVSGLERSLKACEKYGSMSQ